MAEAGQEVTTHGETNFDPETYIDYGYEHFTGDRKEDEFVKFVLHALHDFYKQGEITGDRLLDLGTGPVCHTIYAASKWFSKIVLSDFAEPNLAVLRSWKEGNIRHQKAVFEYMLQLDGSQEDWIAANKRLAEKVSCIIPCDLRREDVLAGTDVDGLQFDAINLILCQSVSCFTIDDFRKVVANYSRLLRPGGHIVTVDALEQSFYEIGEDRFRVLNVTRKQVQTVMAETGYDVLAWRQGFAHEAEDVRRHLYAMVARKQ